jgi:hypothetical protein
VVPQPDVHHFSRLMDKPGSGRRTEDAEMMFFGGWMMLAGLLMLGLVVAVPVAVVALVVVLVAQAAKR